MKEELQSDEENLSLSPLWLKQTVMAMTVLMDLLQEQ